MLKIKDYYYYVYYISAQFTYCTIKKHLILDSSQNIVLIMYLITYKKTCDSVRVETTQWVIETKWM